VSKPVTLTINSFLCKPTHAKKEVCGADASANIKPAPTSAWLWSANGLQADVKLAIQIEAVKVE